MATKIKAFSLIELMVVIAIIGILAAIAIPAYNTYIITSKLATVVPVVNKIMSDSSLYWAKYSVLPSNANQLGYSSTSGSTSVDNPSGFSQYLSALSIASQGTPTSSACNGAISISGTFNIAALGMSSSFANHGSFTCYLFNATGILYNNCSYEFDLSGVYQTTNFFPQWYGCQESTCTSPRPYYQQKDGYGNNPGFTASNCS